MVFSYDPERQEPVASGSGSVRTVWEQEDAGPSVRGDLVPEEWESAGGTSDKHSSAAGTVPGLPSPPFSPTSSTSSSTFAREITFSPDLENPGSFAPTLPPPPPPAEGPPASPHLAFPTTPPATPRPPRERQNSGSTPRARKPPYAIPLDRLIPVGTVVLPLRRLSDTVAQEEAEDGWSKLFDGTLEAIGNLELLSLAASRSNDLPSPSTAAAPVKIKVDVEPEVASPSSPSKKGKRNAASGPPPPPPAKKARVAKPHDILADVVALQHALVLRATFRIVGNDALLRIYLIASDLPDRRMLKATRPADNVVLRVLKEVREGASSWEGVVEPEGRSLLDEPDKRSLLELYRAVESPSDDPSVFDQLEGMTPEIYDRLYDAITESPEGMITELYPYQKHSVAKMLARELVPQSYPDPAYLQTSSSIDGTPFFIGVGGEICLSPKRVREPKGGVLAEEMGTGKTAICLALILSTVGEPPDLSDVSTNLDGTPSPPPTILTSIGRQFPFSSYVAEENRRRPRVPFALVEDLWSIWTAVEIDQYNAALARQAHEDALRPRKPIPSLRNLLVHLIKSRSIPYSSSDELLAESGLLAELDSSMPFYTIYPSPEQLNSREGRKGGYGCCEMLVSTASLLVVPTTLVRQWKHELFKHVSDGALKVLALFTAKDKFPPTPEELSTFDVVLLSVARFSDAANDLNSPLRKIHWKRILVDEGHSLSGSNLLRKFAEDLPCEARWAISGTPTTNLRGADDEGALFSQRSTSGGTEADFNRLGEIVCRFLHHPAFPKPGDWRHIITVPILYEGRGARRVADILDRSFIRNAPDRIQKAYTLPSLTSRVVYLDMLPAERKTYNALLAVFAVNSIQSQRSDEDYLFHKKNKKFLDELTLNLSTSSFFFASSDLYKRLHDAIKYSYERLNSDKSVTWSDEDKEAQTKAIAVMQESLDDPEWRHVVNNIGVAIEVDNLDAGIVEAYGGLTAERTILSVSSLVTLKRALKEVRRPDVGAPTDDEELVEELITCEQKRLREMNSTEEPTSPTKKGKRKLELEVLLPLPDNSALFDVTVGATTSAKLNYVLQEVNRHSGDKFIVFCSTLSDLVFAHLSEAFDVLGISHLILAGHANKRDRGETAALFNSSPVEQYRALLVDAKIGGRGMHLTGANRIIMLEPIWLPDLEVQAVKRAHRLGQTKRVDLQVLVITGSYEDALLVRRGQLTQTDFNKTKQPQGDSKLRDLLQSAKYLEPVAAAPNTAPPPRTKLFRKDDPRMDLGGAEVAQGGSGIAAHAPPGLPFKLVNEGSAAPSVKKQKKSVAFV